MTTRKPAEAPQPVFDQVAASIVRAFDDARATSLGAAIDQQLTAFEDALNEIENVYGFLRDPKGQLGNPTTKHGEIAEVVDVGVRRARDCVDQVPMSAHMEGVARTGPSDFILNGVNAQSKFLNGTAPGLGAVVRHMNANAAFVDGGGVYVVPKDQYEVIDRVLRGDTSGLSTKTVSAIQKRIQEIGDRTDRPPLEVLKPSVSAYSDVQPGNIARTMGQHKEDLEQRQKDQAQEIRDEHKASIQEGLRVTAAAAAVGATVSFAAASFRKYKQGKNVFRGDFDAGDWKEVGGEAAMGALGGALTGAAVYLMTNSANLPAPLAGAFVSAVKGLRSLVSSYLQGQITGTELIDAGLFVCSDVALIGVCTAVGQGLIPVPVLGALVGSIAGKCLSSLLESQLGEASKLVRERLDAFMKDLCVAQRELVSALVARYDALGELATRAFDVQSNLALLQFSVELADVHGVPADLVLRSEDDVDRFMSS